jgi:hypothetical protein
MRIEQYPHRSYPFTKDFAIDDHPVLRDRTKAIKVLKGMVGIQAPPEGNIVGIKKRFIPEIFHPGELIPHIHVPEEPPTGATMLPLTDKTAITVFDIDYNDPEVNEALLQASLERLGKSERLQSLVNFGEAPNKVAYSLLDIAGKKDIVEVTQELIGAHGGVSCGRAALVLRDFNRAKLVGTGLKTVEIKERDTLETLAAYF